MRIGTASLVRAPLDRLTEWVAYQLNSGIDEMHLFFDDPDDPGLDFFRDHPAIHCYACDEEFWKANVPPVRTEPANKIQDKQFVMLWVLLNRQVPRVDWLAHIDSDELIWAPGDVRAALERELRPDVQHVQMRPAEAVPPKLQMTDPFREVRMFKEARKDRYPLANRLGVRRPFRGGVFFRGHRKGKPFVRVGRVRYMNAHGPGPSECRAMGITSEVATELRVLHYDAGNFDEWLAKWRNRAVHAGKISRARQRQTDRFERAAARGGKRVQRKRLKRLYRREYMLTGREARILRVLGLVRRIIIDPELFEMPRAKPESDT